MRNLIPFKVCKRHLFITFIGIITLVQVLFGTVVGATQFEYTSEKGSNTFPVINNATNIESIVNLESISLAPELFTDSPSYPEASFSTNAGSSNSPLTVQFYDTSKDAIKWNWGFGDGGTSTQQNPAHTYSKAGTYTVTLTAGNENGTSLYTNTVLVKSLTVLVMLLPEARFSTNTSSGNAPLTVQFNGTFKNATSWIWDFRDRGSTSTEQNPVHTFTTAGTFNVTLTARNENGTSLLPATTTILAKQLPEASFSTNISTGNAPLTVQFNDTSKNTTNWNWDFGDVGTSTEQNPVHTYTAGTFNVTLTAINGNGTSLLPATTTILAKQLPEANFSTNATNGNPPLTVQFNDISKNATSWNWDFKDGGTSTQQNTTHTFTKDGNYSVTLTARNENGSSTFNATILVKLLPTADFKTNPISGSAPLKVQFNDTSKNAESWSWDFTSDGTMDSNELNPTYTYSTSGTYNVTLTVSNSNGTASKNTTITVVKATSTSSSSGSSGGSSGTTKTTTTSKSKSKSSGTSTQSVSLTQNSTNNSTNVTNNTNATNATNVSQNTTDSKKSPAFEMFFSTVSLLAVFIFRRWKSD